MDRVYAAEKIMKKRAKRVSEIYWLPTLKTYNDILLLIFNFLFLFLWLFKNICINVSWFIYGVFQTNIQIKTNYLWYFYFQEFFEISK